MSTTFTSRRISANANTLRRLISDAPIANEAAPETESTKPFLLTRQSSVEQTGPRPAASIAEHMQPLVLQSPLALQLENEIHEENAFADIGDQTPPSAANSSVEPVITKSNLLVLTEQAVEQTVDSVAPDRIQQLIEEIIPVRVANIFAENSEEFVNQAVTTFAPAHINELIEKLAPSLIEAQVANSVQEKIIERLEEELPGGMQDSVARVVKDEMQGAFGYTVTRKIRQLIREELRIVIKS